MAETQIIQCSITPFERSAAGKLRNAGTAAVCSLKIYSASGTARAQTFFKEQQITLHYGDRLECVSGMALLTFHPNHPNLTHNVLLRTEMEVNNETINPREMIGPNLKNYTMGGHISTASRHKNL